MSRLGSAAGDLVACQALLALLFASQLFAAEAPAPDSLFEAIQKGDTAAVKRLLNQGVSANAQDSEGTLAVMAAALYGSPDSIKLLLDHGANPNSRNTAGATALHWAVPDAAKVRLLLGAGADANARSTNFQRTPLLVAASYPGSTEVLRLLLKHGADIHAKDRGGMHALGRAAVSADVDVVRFLVEHGCDPNEPGYGSHVRFARHYLPTLEYLLFKGARVANDAIAMATHWEDPKLIERWIDLGADVNARAGPYRRTALMTAAASEQSSAATLKLLPTPTPKMWMPNAPSIGRATAPIRSKSRSLNSSALPAATGLARKPIRRPNQAASKILAFPSSAP